MPDRKHARAAASSRQEAAAWRDHMHEGHTTPAARALPLPLGGSIVCGCLLALLFCAPPSPAMAASPLDVLDREAGQGRPEPLSQPRIEIREDQAPSGADLGAEFILNSLSVSGSTVYSEDELLAPWRHLLGKPVKLSQIHALARDLTARYRNDGYLLSRVVIPDQQVDQGGAHIRLAAVEGFVESVSYSGDERILDRFRSYFAPVERKFVGRKPLKHGELERYLLLMQDVPGLEISTRFQRGGTPGGSVLHIGVKGDLIDGSAGWGNTGTKDSGPGMGSVSLGVNALPFLGQRTSVTYSQANNHEEYRSTQVAGSYQMWNGLKVEGSWLHSDSPRMNTDFAKDFDYRTSSDTFRVGVSHPIIRSRDLNLGLGVSYEHRNSTSHVLDERFTRDRLRTLSAGLNFDFSDSLGGVTQIIPTIYRGLNIFDATDRSLRATNTLAPAEFWKFGIYASRNQQLPYGFSLFAAAEAQFSDKSLSSYNKFSLGGQRFGRGYEPGIVEGDNGFAVSAEPRWTHRLSEKTAIQLFTFIDWGTVWTNRSVWGVPDSQTASSLGGGVRLWGHVGDDRLPDFNLSAFVAQPLERIERKHDRDEYARFVLQFSLSF